MTDIHQHTSRRTQATASVAAILAESAARIPDDVAVIVGDRRTTYAELWSQTLAYAGALRARGVREGDRVAMLVPNVEDFPRVYYATLALGAVAVPVHALLKRREIEYVLRDSGASLLVCAAPLLTEGAAGAALAAGNAASVVFLNTTVAACAGLLGWAVVDRVRHGVVTSLGSASGIIADPPTGTIVSVSVVLGGREVLTTIST
ncbi:AMP-binding protein, partial [Bacillus sp. S34]|nr:AMP-binding protein [Bacillus sp. S34]